MMDLLNMVNTVFLEPFSYGFMQRGLLTALMTGVVCAVLSCFLILKGWSMMGDAISHAVLPGIILAFIAGLPLVAGAFGAGIFCAAATGYIHENSRIKEDTVMGIVFSGMFALGIVMLTKVDTSLHLMHILFGDMLGITKKDIIGTAMITGTTILIIALKWRDFLLYCFDPAYARVAGLNTKILHFGLLLLLSLTIIAALKAVGIILVIAMLIAPGALAFLLTKSFSKMLLIAILAAVTSCVGGTMIAFHADVATGPAIIAFQAVIFIAALILHIRKQPKHSELSERPV